MMRMPVTPAKIAQIAALADAAREGEIRGPGNVPRGVHAAAEIDDARGLGDALIRTVG